MKTKLTSIFLILILCLSVAACGQDEAQSVLEEVNEVVSGTSGKTDADDESDESGESKVDKIVSKINNIVDKLQDK